MSFEFVGGIDERPPATADADLDGLHFAAVIGGRRLYFAAIPAQARFRITMARAWEQRTAHQHSTRPHFRDITHKVQQTKG